MHLAAHSHEPDWYARGATAWSTHVDCQVGTSTKTLIGWDAFRIIDASSGRAELDR